MLYEEELLEISDRLNGLILKKAEMSKNFEGTYTRVFDSLRNIESADDIRILEVLGELGG
jgi:phage-related tail protein